jgi:hypothetical protein
VLTLYQNQSCALTVQRFIDLLLEPLKRLVSPFAIEEGELDIENAE